MFKKYTSALFLVFVAFVSSAQTKVYKHKYYTTTFDTVLHYPKLVEWWVYKERCGCDNPDERDDQFGPDVLDKKNTNLTKSYKSLNKAHKNNPDPKFGNGIGYDQGHMCPAADNLCMGEQAQTECFYYSNMAPQTPQCNRGNWRSLETYTRTLCLGGKINGVVQEPMDSIHVWCGSYGKAERVGDITVPEYCWKVIYIKKQKKYEAYLFKNNYNKPFGKVWKDSCTTTRQFLEEKTGYRFK